MILNLTGAKLAQEQAAAGMYDPPAKERARLARLLKFDARCGEKELAARAREFAAIAWLNAPFFVRLVAIGGPVRLLPRLAEELRARDLVPVFRIPGSARSVVADEAIIALLARAARRGRLP